MDFIEVSAKTVEEAITKACIEMGTSSDNVDIEVVSEGSGGFLGLGSKPAVVKATRKVAGAEDVVGTDDKKETKKKAKKGFKEAKKEAKEAKKEVKKETKNATTVDVTKSVQEKIEEPKRERVERHREPPVIRPDEEIAQIKELAQEFLSKIFASMEMPVEMVSAYNNESGNLDIDFTGEEMGVLIGKRGQTLDSLQYLTSLVVNKNREGYIRVKLDTENYRNRRKDTLESLARNIAYKVKKTRKDVSLEPMNPYERRIIHSSLQGNKFVETFSEGAEPYRHIVITLKK